MTIEVRQLLIRSQVNPAPAQGGPLPTALSDELRERIKQDVLAACLAECKAWLAQAQRDQRER